MKFKSLYITLLSCVLFGGIVCAQSLKIDAIEIVTIGHTGDDDFRSYDHFVSNSRNPAQFRSDLLNQPDEAGTIRETGFALDFIFVQTNEPVNEFYIGIQSSTVEAEVFKELSFQDDSSLVRSDITNTSQFFTIRTGYHRIFRSDKRIKILAGTMLQFGIPVSSNTTQSLISDFGSEEYQFFAKQSIAVGYAISYGIRFRLFRNVHATLIGRPTFYFTRFDGSASSNLLRGTNLNIQFKIRP